MSGIWIFAEERSTLLELMGEGRRMADRLGATLTAMTHLREDAETALNHGADDVIHLVIPAGQPLESAAAQIALLAAEGDPDLLLVGATLRGKELAARVAARLGVALVTDATALHLGDDGQLQTERMIYGGGGVSRQRILTRPQMATVPARMFEPAAAGARAGAIREVAVAVDQRVRVTERRPRQQTGTDIAASPAVVGVGRGLANESDLALVEGLAAAMGGAVGCTRPVAEDLGWLPEDRYIGISGRKIAPRVYVAVATSGQVQHVAGVRDAKLVVAINKDENAPIFKSADYGLVGDLYQILPELTAALKARQGV